VSIGIGYSAVSIVGDDLYTMGNVDGGDCVYCLNSDTGAEKWKYSYPSDYKGDYAGTTSTPTVDGEYVYTLSRDGGILCLARTDGKMIWTKNAINDFGATYPDWRFASSPLILDNKLIVDVGITIAFDKINGDLIWKTKNYGGGYSSPYAFMLDGKQLLAVFNKWGLVILDPENGQEICGQEWNTKNTDVNVVTPIVSGNEIFISSDYDKGSAVIEIIENKARIIWENKNMRNHFNNCVLWKGFLYGFDESSELRCMDFQTGDIKWSQRGMGKGSLMLADEKLIIMGENGQLVIAEASPDSFKEIARAKVLDGLCWTMPVLYKGKIYCRNHEGSLICLDLRG